MKLNIGRGVKDTVRALAPTNHGITHIAQNRIDYLASAQAARSLNASNTDGTSSYLFLKMRRGAFCTCQQSRVTVLNKNIHNLTDNNELSSQTDTVIPTESGLKFKVFRARGAVAPVDIFGNGDLESVVNKAYEDKIGQEINDDEERSRQDLLDSIKDMAEDLEDPEDVARQKQSAFSVFGGEQTQCGICFGSGFVEGYQMHGGQRLILDVTKNPLLTGGAQINTDTTPYKIIIPRNNSATVCWQSVRLPTFYERALGLFVRNNIDNGLAYTLEYSDANANTWAPLTLAVLVSRNGQNNLFDIRLKSSISDTEQHGHNGALEITHVEMYFEFAPSLMINMPSFPKNVDFQQFDVLQQIQVEVPATVAHLDREAVIIDRKYGQAWSVIEVDTKATASGQIFLQTCTLRLVQQYEQRFLLNLARGLPVTLNYAGTQERRQGDTYFPIKSR